ncbi:MAG: hypothetical protein WC759_04125 [Candidatus Micrarchaeia archaeon]|jgi:chromosome segregation ATPase
MAEDSLNVTTGIDGLIKLVHDRGRIELGEAARLVGVAPQVAEGWARSLEEQDLLKVEYQLTKIYLVWKELDDAELGTRVQKVQAQKSAVAQDIAALIERARTRSGEMEEIRGELDKLSGAMDDRLPANLRRRLDALHDVDRDKEKIFQAKMQSLDEVKGKLDAIERDISTKRELLEQMRERAKAVENTPELKQRVNEILDARKKLDETLGNIKEMRGSLDEEMKRSTDQKKQMTGVIDAMGKLEGKMDEMLKAKKDAQALIENLDSQVKEIDRHLGTMREMLVSGEVTENMKRLGREKEKIEALEREINAQNTVLAERTDSIENALKVHETKYEELLKAKNRLLSSVEDYEVDLAGIDSSFRREAEQMRKLADEMTSVLNANKKDIEVQLELARKGLEKYETALSKRDQLLAVRDTITEMEEERDRLVKQLRLLSKSMQLLDVQAELSGKGTKLAELKEGVKEVRKTEKAFDSRRDELREKMKGMLEGKKKK